MKKYLAEGMVPVLAELKRALEAARHPLLGQLLATFRALLKEHKGEVRAPAAFPMWVLCMHAERLLCNDCSRKYWKFSLLTNECTSMSAPSFCHPHYSRPLNVMQGCCLPHPKQ